MSHRDIIHYDIIHYVDQRNYKKRHKDLPGFTFLLECLNITNFFLQHREEIIYLFLFKDNEMLLISKYSLY